MKQNKEFAPIVVFVYNREKNVANLVDSLRKTEEAKYSTIYFFSDGPKTDSTLNAVNAVRGYLHKIEKLGYFKDTHIIEAPANKGLAKSIIDGVSYVMEKYGRVIVIEDDVVVAPDFLDYMNRGLSYYENDTRIATINGYTHPYTFSKAYDKDVFMIQRISSCTWASWKRVWDLIDWDIEKIYPRFFANIRDRKIFNYDGADRSLMLDAQVCKQLNSWAIRFDYSTYKHNMYNISPVVSRVKNDGSDGSGTNGIDYEHKFDTQIMQENKKAVFEKILPDMEMRKEYAKIYKLGVKRRILGNLDKIVLYFLKTKR